MKKLKNLTINLLLLVIILTSFNLKTVSAYGSEPVIFVESGELPVGRIGDVFSIDVSLVNKSKYFAKDIQVTPQLNDEVLELSDLLDYQEVKKLSTTKSESVSFKLRVKETAKPGVYPLTLNIKYNNAASKSYNVTRTIYYKVVDGKENAKVDVKTVMITPDYPKAGKEAEYQITVSNTGERAASDIVFTLESLATENFTLINGVNKKSIDALKPGESNTLKYTLSLNKSLNTGTHAISYKITYKDEFGKEHTKESEFYTSVLAKDDEVDSNNKTAPKIILSSYKTSPDIVMAGANFNLDATFYNTNSITAVKNVKVTMTMKESEDSNGNKAKNVFTPVNSTNVVYIDSLEPRSSAPCNIAFNVAKFAEAKTYIMVLKMEYEDNSGNQYKAQEEIFIRVSQEPVLGIDNMNYNREVGLNDDSWFNAYVYNKSGVPIYNVLVKIEGENIEPAKTSYYLGKIDKYNGQSLDTRITALVEGKLTGMVTFTYEDGTGKQYEQKKQFDLNCRNYYKEWGDKEEPEEPEPEGTPVWKKVLRGLIAGIVGLIALVVFLKRRKKKKIKAFEERIINEIMKNQ